MLEGKNWLEKSAPGGTRIPNLLIRSQKLYPIELRAPEKNLPIFPCSVNKKKATEGVLNA
jgi:hypothetical protein